MAYTIRFPETFHMENFKSVVATFLKFLQDDGRFCVEVDGPVGNRKGLPKKASLRICCILRRVRLTQKKPYCGQHAGECIVHPLFGAQKKRNLTYLEYNDWIQFNTFVNDFLDKHLELSNADVWSDPQECKGTFWIRKNGNKRVRYDIEETFDRIGRRIQHWNLGDSSQFGS